MDDAPAMIAVLAAIAAEDRWVRTQVPFDVAGRTEDFAAAMRAGRAHAFVAERDGDVVGNVVTFDAAATGGTGLGMGVLASARGIGIGGALLDAAIGGCTARGVTEIRLEAYAHNTAALSLYASRGFVERGERYFEERREGQRWLTIRMVRRIA